MLVLTLVKSIDSFMESTTIEIWIPSSLTEYESLSGMTLYVSIDIWSLNY